MKSLVCVPNLIRAKFISSVDELFYLRDILLWNIKYLFGKLVNNNWREKQSIYAFIKKTWTNKLLVFIFKYFPDLNSERFSFIVCRKNFRFLNGVIGEFGNNSTSSVQQSVEHTENLQIKNALSIFCFKFRRLDRLITPAVKWALKKSSLLKRLKSCNLMSKYKDDTKIRTAPVEWKMISW